MLPPDLRNRARADDNGEVSWHVSDAPSVLSCLEEAGRVVLGLDVRDYDEGGSFLEVPWSVYNGADPSQARAAALVALDREEMPGEWVLITW